jgi:hypothetical protein
MTTNLTQLSDALQQDTPEELLKRRIIEKKDEIQSALDKGETYVLDRERGLVIAAG